MWVCWFRLHSASSDTSGINGTAAAGIATVNTDARAGLPLLTLTLMLLLLVSLLLTAACSAVATTELGRARTEWSISRVKFLLNLQAANSLMPTAYSLYSP